MSDSLGSAKPVVTVQRTRPAPATVVLPIALWASCLTLIVGCNPSPFDSTVTGTVTLDGNPIGPGVIQYVPTGRQHNPATGTIQVDGSYVLKTSNSFGLHAGEYDVTVSVYDQPEVAPGKRAEPGSAPLRTPEKYSLLSTTDLKFTVEAGENTIDVPLSSDN